MYIKFNKAKYGLAIISAIFLISGIIWIDENRIGQPLDIDEAGYQSIAISQYHALKYSGVSGWLASLCAPSIQAPSVTATTSLIYYFTGINEHVAFLLQLLCSVGTIIITYLIATRLANSRAGIIAALLIASCPGFIIYSRSYYFVSPTTLIYTSTIYSLIRSQYFTNIKWSFCFGLLLGIMPLTRTMTVAFMPGFFVGALLSVIIGNDHRLKRFFLMLSSIGFGLLVALTWYYYNGMLVWNYLRGYGYGAHVNEYAKKISGNIIANKIAILCNHADLFLPHFIVILIGVLIISIWIFKTIFKDTSADKKNQYCILIITLINVFSFAALQSTENVGSGFYCPLFPSSFAIIASIITISTANFKMQRIYIACAFGIYVITSLPFVPLRLNTTDPASFNIPYIGSLKITDGGGTLLSYLKAGKIALDSDNRLNKKRGREWLEFDKLLAEEIDTFHKKEKTIVVFAFRHHLCNVNTVNLQELKIRKKAFCMEMVDPALIPNSLTGYEGWIHSKDINKSIIITSSGSGTFEPLVNPVFMREALDRCGFLELAKIQSPDGQYVTLWSNERG